jgi:hypothetical protein
MSSCHLFGETYDFGNGVEIKKEFDANLLRIFISVSSKYEGKPL